MKTNRVISNGKASPLGLSIQEGKYNFSIFAEHAEKVLLGLFLPDGGPLIEEYPLCRTGSIWHIAVEGIDPLVTYAFRAKGPHDQGNLYDEKKWLADPYAKSIESPRVWNKAASKEPYVRAFLAAQSAPFDWQDVKAPLIPDEELIIYEMHVRGFTQHPSSGVSHPGTFLGLIEKIPYLKQLGINAIELMPLFEFDETHCKNLHPTTGQRLPNYWGYNSLHFFVPMRRFATSDPCAEFKTMVRELHRNGILVFLDVVYNHTGEGSEKDYYVHFRGLDNSVYYQVLEHGAYRDNTGCGHNVNANHPQVQTFIMDSLRYWAQEMHVDGFRFDLCAALIRNTEGKPMEHSPLIDAITKDPILSKKRLIAEAWDASGLYLLGEFAKRKTWLEWNGKYRDHVRCFIKGTDGSAGLFADALCGSESIYGASHTPLSSINFITSHDGYSLRDLVTYNQKHNLENGEHNRDGSNHNDSWNCGIEGPCDQHAIQELREKQMRNFFLALLLSQGLPMLLMGDEYGHTRNGNNNPYVQDNDINWFIWEKSKEDMLSFLSALIIFRKKHRCFHREKFLQDKDITWHGHKPHEPDWHKSSRFIAYTIDQFYVAFNAHYHSASVELPPGSWRGVIDTQLSWSKQPLVQKANPKTPQHIIMQPHSALLLENFH